MPKPRVLAFAGSARAESFNKKLLRIAAEGVRAADIECTVLDLRDYPLPIYDGDCEGDSGLPEAAVKLREQFVSHDGLLIASPEYNGLLSPLLKNTIDWVTRSPEAQPDLSGFKGKVAMIMAASPGPLGGLRGLTHVRTLLTNVGCIVLPDQITIRSAFSAFGESGELADDKQQARVMALGRKLAQWLQATPSG